jgi:hypothetical protein
MRFSDGRFGSLKGGESCCALVDASPRISGESRAAKCLGASGYLVAAGARSGPPQWK